MGWRSVAGCRTKGTVIKSRGEVGEESRVEMEMIMAMSWIDWQGRAAHGRAGGKRINDEKVKVKRRCRNEECEGWSGTARCLT